MYRIAMQKRRCCALLLAVGSLALAAPARATVYDIGYTGTGDFDGSGFATAHGTGSFTIPGDPAHATLNAIAAFSFILQMPGAAPVAYGLADLPAFAAVAPHGTLIALLPPTGAVMWTETIEATNLPDGSFSGGSDVDLIGSGGFLADGTMAVSEPATLAVLGVGLTWLAWRRRRAKDRRKDQPPRTDRRRRQPP
jgi:hypothetical protein